MSNRKNRDRVMKPRTVEIPVSEYADLLRCKYRAECMDEMEALRDTIRNLESLNAQLLNEKYGKNAIIDLLKGECESESV